MIKTPWHEGRRVELILIFDLSDLTAHHSAEKGRKMLFSDFQCRNTKKVATPEERTFSKMELLAGYESASSSSSQSRTLTINHNHDPVLARAEKDALQCDAAHDSHGAGNCGHRAPRAAGYDGRGDDGRRGADGPRGAATAIRERANEDHGMIATGASIEGDAIGSEVGQSARKKRKRDPISAVQHGKGHRSNAVIAGDDPGRRDCPDFVRHYPHWEGRWVGHLCLPFPPLECLDPLGVDAAAANGSPIQRGGERTRNELREESHGEVRNGGCESSGSGEESSSDEEDDCLLPRSRAFLPAARTLIHYWAKLLEGEAEEATTNGKDDAHATSATVIFPHIPMHPVNAATTSTTSRRGAGDRRPSTPLHISLARPIRLPTPSVDPFLADIGTRLTVVASVAQGKGHARPRAGRTLHVQPRSATIFVNDPQTRSFLGMPLSEESARWVKRLLVPPIDGAMARFGLETYHEDEEGGCIPHVSVASVQGNVIPHMLRQRTPGRKSGNAENVKFISLFSDLHTHTTDVDASEYIPLCIPIRVNQIQCQFGEAKQISIPL